MPLTICVYEDDRVADFYPISYLRPVYSMRAGIVPLFRRMDRFQPKATICLAARNHLAGMVAAEHKDFPVNIVQRDPEAEVLFVNGRLRDPGDLFDLVKTTRLTTVFKNQGETVAVLFKKECLASLGRIATPEDFVKILEREASASADYDTTATLYHRCWEIMADVEHEIVADFPHLTKSLPTPQDVTIHDGFMMIKKDDIYLGNGVEAMSGSIIDASHGPVFIGDYTKIEPQAAIYGPCYIGPNSVVVAGKIAGSSIGHTCRVGGEVEESVFQAYVNKYHAGFIGHSYVGSWVNFGAMTTNSDLKNNYSTIRVSVNGESIDSGSIKVGSFIGDHTKFGIGTLLNTGINIGVCCNIYGGTLISDKEVASFSWGNTDGYQTYRFDKAVETARRTAGRRNVDLSDEEEAVLEALSKGESPMDGVVRWKDLS